jgi:hypothetical protein
MAAGAIMICWLRCGLGCFHGYDSQTEEEEVKVVVGLR